MRTFAALLAYFILTLSTPIFANAEPEVTALASPLQESASKPFISATHALVLGVVEGLTEYLPISSTGHLVITNHLLGLRHSDSSGSENQLAAIQAFEIVIQIGAILAVMLLYSKQLLSMAQGLVGRSTEGRQLLINLIAAFIPTAVVGLLLKDVVSTYLQFSGPVLIALVGGGIIMIIFSRSSYGKKLQTTGHDLTRFTPKQAVVLGLLQCLALWPGTSRSMVTIMGGMVLGLTPIAAAEFSFLLGLATLSAASLYKLLSQFNVIMSEIGITAILVGSLAAAVSAAIAVKAFVAYLNRLGLAPFGWYRIGLAALIAYLLYV